MCLGAQVAAQHHRVFGHDKAMFYEDSGYWDEAWEAQQQGCTDDSPDALVATAEAWAVRRVAGLDNKLMWQLHLAEHRTPPETGQPKSQQHRNQQRIAAAARRVAAAEEKAARAVMMVRTQSRTWPGCLHAPRMHRARTCFVQQYQGLMCLCACVCTGGASAHPAACRVLCQGLPAPEGHAAAAPAGGGAGCARSSQESR